MATTDSDPKAMEGCTSPCGDSEGKVIAGLAAISPQTLVDEHALAYFLGVTTRTVRRMVTRQEIPPPVPLAGRSTWVAGKVIAHIEARAERAARKAEQEAQRLASLGTGN